MTLEILLPALPGGAARLLRWLAAEGAALERGAPLAIVLTDCAEVLLPAPAAGVLAGPVAVGAALEPGAKLGELAPAAAPAPGPAAAPAPRRPRATPLARSIALAHALDLAAVAGSGPGGRVGAADVRALLPATPAAAPAPPAPPRPQPHAAPAPAAARPGDPPPVATATVELDAGAALGRIAGLGPEFARLRLPLGLAACVVEAAAAQLPAHPALNARWGADTIVLRRRLHVAAAEPSGAGGLRWAMVADAGDLTLRGVARALGATAAGDLGAATFAVVCLAPGAAWQSAAPPLPGTAAALSVGAPARRAVAVGDAVAVRPVATLTLSYDARVADHRDAAAFLQAVKAALEHGG